VATARITVTPVNDPPEAVDDTYFVNQDTVLAASEWSGVLRNDVDIDGDTLTAAKETDPAHGALTMASDGSFVYTPTTGYYGYDTFTYRADDGIAHATATVSITINGAPTAEDISVATLEDTSITINVVPQHVSDPDPDGGIMGLLWVDEPSHGTASITADWYGVIYTPTLDFEGVDGFSYSVCDIYELCTTAWITVTVGGVNDPPEAWDDVDVTDEDVARTIDVLANDSDPDGQIPSIMAVGAPARGTATIVGGAILYEPYPDLYGVDTFTYTITDGILTDTAVVTITVRSVEDAPTLGPIRDLALEPGSGPQMIDLTGISSGAANEIQTLTVTASSFNEAVIAPPTVNYASPAPTGTLTLTPVPGEVGAATISVTVTDGVSSTMRTFDVTVWETDGPIGALASGAAGLFVMDLTRSDNPRPVGWLDTPGDARDVAFPYSAGELAGAPLLLFVADGPAGLLIADLSAPESPVVVGAAETPGFANGVVVSGSVAFVADGYAGVTMIDVSDPTAPAVVSTSDTPGYASKVEAAGRYVYVADADGGLRIFDTQAPLGQATACDRAGNCTTEPATVVDTVRAAAAAQPPTSTVAILSVPPVLASTDPLTITGKAQSAVSTLETLTVTVDGVPIHVQPWAPGTVTSTLWTAPWSPLGLSDGKHTLRAELVTADGARADHALSVVLDTEVPTLTIVSRTLTRTHYHPPGTMDVSGTMDDAGGVKNVQLDIEGSTSNAALDTDTWLAQWVLGGGLLPDGETVTATAQAMDVAGRTTTVTETLFVDVAPPTPVELSMTSGATPVLPGATLRTISPTLTLTWTASSDGSGLSDYDVIWRLDDGLSAAQHTASVAPSGVRASQRAVGEARKVGAQVAAHDVHGHETVERFAPLYVDGPRTPDYVVLRDPDGVYRGWMDSGCSMVGTDRRVDRTAMEQTALSTEQRFYVTWNGSQGATGDGALRLAWTGANWATDGDLFVYLDTEPGGATEAFDPSPPAATETPVALPDGMGADWLVWVRDEATAILMAWEDAVAEWRFVEPLGPASYQFNGDLNGGQTDLYLPFAVLGIVDPAATSLDLVALAAEDVSLEESGSALSIWAVMPNVNPLSSGRVIQTKTFAGSGQELTLAHRYHWDALDDGVCPNGSDAPGTVRAFLDAELEVELTTDPPGAAFSLLGDDLFWLRDLLMNAPADVTSHLDFRSTSFPPLGDGDTLSYTLSFRNRGTDPAYGVSAELTSLYALNLGSVTEIYVGEIGPGERVTRTFSGSVDTGSSPEPWAAVQVEAFDAGHPAAGEPLEWLWAHHRVDTSPPVFYGIERPRYVIAAGQNQVSGYAYDTSGVSAVEGRIEGGASLFQCNGSQVQAGRWSCAWQTSGASHGQSYAVQLRATDAFGQASAWSRSGDFVVDDGAPELTLDHAASGAVHGDLVRGPFTLVGAVTDDDPADSGVASVQVCVDGACGDAALTLSPSPAAVSYEDEPSPPLAIDAAASCGGAGISRVFSVTQDFVIDHIRLGFNAAHTHRDDISVILESPSGTVVEVLRDDQVSGTAFRNYDVLLHDAAATGYAVAEDDPAPPLYQRLARPAEPLDVFRGEGSHGEWTLRICDENTGADDGLYNLSRLTLYPRDTGSKTGRWTYNVPIPDGLDYVSRTIAIYAEDLVGNRTTDPVSLTVWADNVAPQISVTDVLSEVVAHSAETVLQGTCDDGNQVGSLLVTVKTPAGVTRQDPGARHSAPWDYAWEYVLRSPEPGTYKLWAVATDPSGNSSSAGPFEVHAGCTAASLTARVLQVEPAAHSPYSVTVTFAVSNTGAAPVDAGLPVGVYVNGGQIASVSTASRLEMGGSAVFSATWAVASPGAYDLSVVPNDGATFVLCKPATSDERSVAVQDLPLYPSWNLVSSFAAPFADDPGTVQRTIAGQYTAILGFEDGAMASHPETLAGMSSLESIDGVHGYWIKTSGGGSALHGMGGQEEDPEEMPVVATLRLVGQGLPLDHPIDLEAGWNLVSYLPRRTMTVQGALRSIDGLYKAVVGFEPEEAALSYYPDLDASFNTLHTMKPGNGYWIKMREPGTLVYPADSSDGTASRAASVNSGISERDDAGFAAHELLSEVAPTYAWVNLYGPALGSDEQPLPISTTVVAVDPDGVVCGAVAVSVEGQFGLLPCYGDDLTTAQDEGAEPGDILELLVDGEVLGHATWTEHGERRRVGLGITYEVYLPLVVRGLAVPTGFLPTPTPSPTALPEPLSAPVAPTADPQHPDAPVDAMVPGVTPMAPDSMRHPTPGGEERDPSPGAPRGTPTPVQD